MTTGIHEFVAGFLGLSRGMMLIISNPRILKWAIVPFIVGFFVFLLGLALGLPSFASLLPLWIGKLTSAAIADTQSTSYVLLYWTLLIASWPVAIVGLLYLLLIITRVITIPFVAILAETTMRELGVTGGNTEFHLTSWLRTNGALLWVSAVKALILGVIGVILFLLSFIPGVALFSMAGFLVIAAYDIIDISLEVLQMGLKDRMRFFRDHLPAFSGFAVAMGLVFLVPGLNFFLFPAAVVGGGDVLRRLLQAKSVRAMRLP